MYVVKITDGLGNQMFQYAFARKLQLSSGKKVYLDTRFINNEDRPLRAGEKNIFLKKSDYREYELNQFKIRIPIANEKILSHWNFLQCNNEIEKAIFRLSQNRFWIWQYLCENNDNKATFFKHLDKRLPVYLEGYFFNQAYFEDIRGILQREFKLKQPVKLSSELKTALNNPNSVSVHIRRGDFLKLNRDISHKSYYTDAMARMKKDIENPIWLFFSDDIEWVKENINVSEPRIYVSGMEYEDYEELIIMKNCKNHILANSTFSYWAAYLNSYPDKKVICPRRWKPEIVPKEWIKI